MRLFRLFFTTSVAMLAALASGCQTPDSEREPEQIKAVTYYTIDGVWELTELNDKPLSEDTMLYIDFDRKEHRFEMWDNLNSMYPTMRSGGFVLSVDDKERDIISGWYDYGVGDWAYDYVVELNAEGDRMVWRTATNEDELLFVAIEALPEF